MYRCQLCGRAVGPRVPARRLVLETRERIYPRRPKSKKVWVKKDGKWKRDWEPDYGGVGVETVREAMACPECSQPM